MPITRVLPPELLDEVIDHLWDDHKSLEACSLTCRSWVSTSRLHLFRTARVRNAGDCTSLSALLDSSPVIARCIRKLTIDAEYSGVNADGEPVEDDAWVNAAAGLLSKLERVNTLALSRMRWNALTSETTRAFEELFKTVKTLYLYEVRFDASANVLKFLSDFPELHELYLHGISWTHESSSPRSPTSTDQVASTREQRMDLTYLFLDPKSSPTLVTEWLLSHPSEQHLRTIQLCWRDMYNTKALGDLLQASGSELECLQIEFPSGLSDEALTQNQLSLAHNTGLRSLQFGGLDVSAASSRTILSDKLFPWVTLMLSQVRSPVLREVTFELELPDVPDLQTLDWTRIDRELSRVEFKGLTVRFYVNCSEVVRGKELEDEVRKEIGERLPGFGERGVLRISCI